jgi:hypothetical protein
MRQHNGVLPDIPFGHGRDVIPMLLDKSLEFVGKCSILVQVSGRRVVCEQPETVPIRV